MKLPQLILRDLFWLVVVAAMGCAWWVERSKLLTEIERPRTVVLDPKKITTGWGHLVVELGPGWQSITYQQFNDETPAPLPKQ
jgi:hypothetical protein